MAICQICYKSRSPMGESICRECFFGNSPETKNDAWYCRKETCMRAVGKNKQCGNCGSYEEKTIKSN